MRNFSLSPLARPFLGAAALVLLLFLFRLLGQEFMTNEPLPAHQPESPFVYSFNVAGILEEAPTPQQSASPYWWLDSGGKLTIADGIGSTIAGSLPPLDRWRIAYAGGNSRDTDGGYRPQNLFRLVSKSEWDNVAVAARMRIAATNASESPFRNESNGLLLMERYTDGDTLYYSGIRVDGTAVIKKKYQGTYYTMAQKKIFPGTYNRTDASNLIPTNTWIDLRSEVRTKEDGTVEIILYMLLPSAATNTPQGAWRELLRATDTGRFAGTTPITGAARVGIRTDFMDVQFGSIRVEDI